MYEIVHLLKTLLHSVWHFRWIVVLAAWVVGLAGTAFVILLPNQYKSEAWIHVDTDSLLGPLLHGIAVQHDLSRQLAVMQRTLLSRSNLMEVARSVDLDLQAESEAEMERIIEHLRTRIKVDAERNGLYIVNYVDSEAKRAKDVVQTLLTIFVEGNLGLNREDMASAQKFLRNQITQYETNLRRIETKIANFKSQHSGLLSSGNFSSRLEAARGNVSSARIKLDNAIIRRDQLKAQLENTPQFVEMQGAPVVVVNDSNISMRLAELEATLDDALLRYTEEHPEVKSLRAQIARLESAIEARGTNSGANAGNRTQQIPNSVYEQIQLRLFEVESDVALRKRELEEAEDRLARLNEQAGVVPQLEAQLADMTREYDSMRENYQQLLARAQSADMSEAARVETQSVEFRVVQPPEVPAAPSGPNRPLLLAGVLFVAVGAGVGGAFLRSQLSGAFSRTDALHEYFGVPVLGAVSLAQTPGLRTKRIAEGTALALASGALIAFVAGAAVFAPELSQTLTGRIG